MLTRGESNAGGSADSGLLGHNDSRFWDGIDSWGREHSDYGSRKLRFRRDRDCLGRSAGCLDGGCLLLNHCIKYVSINSNAIGV